MNKYPGRLANYAAGVILLLTALFLFWVFFLVTVQDNPPIESELPLTVDQTEYYPGDYMTVTSVYCRYTTSAATVFPTFLNQDTGLLYFLAPYEANSLPVGCGSASVRSMVPMDLSPGRYVRQIRVVYDVNVLIDRTVEWYTEEFIVLSTE